MRRTLGGFLVLAAALLVGACQPQPKGAAPAALPPDHAGATLYTIDGAASMVTVRVYRDGPLARFGHNHVIGLRQLQGRVFVHRQLARSGFELKAPLAALAVDQPADRLAAGPDFPGELPAEAIAGTRANMLGPKLLAADQFPLLELTALAVRGALPDLIFKVDVSVGGHHSEVEFPAHVAIEGQRLRADGALTLSQRQIGLTPFSVLGGGLRVRDELEILYHLEATRAGSSNGP